MLIVCDTTRRLGRGKFAIVFQGTLPLLDRTQQVAVKRVQLVDIDTKCDKREEEALKFLNHPNVIKLLHVEDDSINFRYYALELCKASLDKLYLKNENKYCGPIPQLGDMLLQLASGLKYIHEKHLVHRDIKPENVLIWVNGEPNVNPNQQVLMKWADFGFCKETNESGSFIMSGVKGTKNWFAPEILAIEDENETDQDHHPSAHDDKTSERTRGSNKSDVFAEGLIFGYILLKGLHPFGNQPRITSNILMNSPVNSKKIQEKHQWLVKEVIENQLKPNPEERMTAEEVFEHLQNTFTTVINPGSSREPVHHQQDDENRLAIQIKNECREISRSDKGMNLYKLPIKTVYNFSRASSFIKRFSFGEPNKQARTSKTILLVGTTGSGKTTMINAMINYILGVEWGDPFRFTLVNEELQGASQAISQTREITVYDLHYRDGFQIPYSLTIVDTPGLGDTGGIKRDFEIFSAIRHLFAHINGIQEIDAMGVVVQSSLVHLTESQESIFNSILSIFGIDIKENVRFLVTFADGSHEPPPVLHAIKAATLPCQMDSNGLPCHQSFNNISIFASNQSPDDTISRNFWKHAMKSFSSFFSVLSRMIKSLKSTKVILSCDDIDNELEYECVAHSRISTIHYVTLSSKVIHLKVLKMKIVYDPSQQLGRGAFAIVFQGTLDKTHKVAVKRVQLADLDIENGRRGEETLLLLDNPNVIKLFYSEDDPNYRYYALELCEASLDKLYLKGGKKYCGPVPKLNDMLLQLASGLKYIHENNLVHRNIKPENVLIWVNGEPNVNPNQQVLMKWAGFGLCKQTNESGSFSMSGIKGAFDWMAPELLAIEDENDSDVTDQNHQCSANEDKSSELWRLRGGSNKSDVFAEGLIFGYILLEGLHPFGNRLRIMDNVLENNPVNLLKIPEKQQWLVEEVIKKQLKPNPKERMTAEEVFEHLQLRSSVCTETFN